MGPALLILGVYDDLLFVNEVQRPLLVPTPRYVSIMNRFKDQNTGSGLITTRLEIVFIDGSKE